MTGRRKLPAITESGSAACEGNLVVKYEEFIFQHIESVIANRILKRCERRWMYKSGACERCPCWKEAAMQRCGVHDGGRE